MIKNFVKRVLAKLDFSESKLAHFEKELREQAMIICAEVRTEGITDYDIAYFELITTNASSMSSSDLRDLALSYYADRWGHRMIEINDLLDKHKYWLPLLRNGDLISYLGTANTAIDSISETVTARTQELMHDYLTADQQVGSSTVFNMWEPPSIPEA